MKKLLYLPLGLLLGLGGLYASGGKPEKTEVEKAQEKADAEAIAKKAKEDESRKIHAQTELDFKAGCIAKGGVVSQCGEDLKVTCNTGADIEGIKVLCDTGKNAAGFKVQMDDVISSDKFIKLGPITKEEPITKAITMPKKGGMVGFTYVPTAGKEEYKNKNVWYLIRDDSSMNVPIIKIYRTITGNIIDATKKSIPVKVNAETSWEEMGTITNKTMTYNELVAAFEYSKENNKGILISPEGRIILDFMAKNPKNNRRIAFSLEPHK